MPMPEIAKETTDPKTGAKRITYKPFVGKVTAHSSYNVPGGKQRFAIEGVDNFWSLGPGVTDLDKEFPNPPPVGYLAVWTLQMSDVTGQFAGPGKHYRDVTKVEKVPDSYVAPAVTAADPNAPSWTGGKDEPVAQAAVAQDAKAQAVSAYDDREQRTRISIEQQVCMKADGEIIAALMGTKAVPAWLNDSVVALIVNRYIGLGQVLAHADFTPIKPEEPDGTPSNQ